MQQELEQRAAAEQLLQQRLAAVEQELAVSKQSAATLSRRQEGLMKMAVEYQQKASPNGHSLQAVFSSLTITRQRRVWRRCDEANPCQLYALSFQQPSIQ